MCVYITIIIITIIIITIIIIYYLLLLLYMCVCASVYAYVYLYLYLLCILYDGVFRHPPPTTRDSPGMRCSSDPYSLPKNCVYPNKWSLNVKK